MKKKVFILPFVLCILTGCGAKEVETFLSENQVEEEKRKPVETIENVCDFLQNRE